MANIEQKNIYTKKNSVNLIPGTAPLDTLAQLSPNSPKPALNKGLRGLKIRAKAKFVSDIITLKLADKQRSKKDKQTFYNTYHCSRLLEQNGQTVTARYCNNRWCVVCNRIRSGKLINGYSKPLSDLKDPYFVTLTVPNIKKYRLKKEIDLMFTEFKRIRKNLHKTKTPIKGIRKLEVTYNHIRDDYHPHFHLIVESKQIALKIVDEWLKRFKKANIKGQDIRPANMNSIVELFKYFTKMFTKEGVNINSLNIIIKALKGRRIVQPIGIKKYISEDVDEVESVVYNELEECSDVWEFVDYDWYSKKTGEALTYYEPSEVLKELVKKIW